jgi:hypothetical protein
MRVSFQCLTAGDILVDLDCGFGWRLIFDHAIAGPVAIRAHTIRSQAGDIAIRA